MRFPTAPATWLGVRGLACRWRVRGQLRDPVPGGVARPSGCSTQTGPLTLVARSFAMFFSGLVVPLVLFPGWTRERGDGAALGGVPPGARRHLARPARRAGRCSAGSRSRRAGPRCCCSACAGWCSGSRPARWWSRVADRVARLARDVRGVRDPGRRCGSGSAWPTARRSCDAGRQRLRDHRLDFVGDRGHVPQRRRARRLRPRPRSRFLYGATGFGLGIARPASSATSSGSGRRIRLGTFDAMMVRPVGVFAQVCADEFALRRLGRIAPGRRGARPGR